MSVWESLIPAMVTPLRFCWFFYMLWGPMRIVYHKIFRSIGPLLHTEILSTTPNFTKSIFLVFPWFLGNFPGYKDFFGMNQVRVGCQIIWTEKKIMKTHYGRKMTILGSTVNTIPFFAPISNSPNIFIGDRGPQDLSPRMHKSFCSSKKSSTLHRISVWRLYAPYNQLT